MCDSGVIVQQEFAVKIPSTYNPGVEWIPVTERLPPFGKKVLACSWMSVAYYVAFVSPAGQWYLSFGNSPILGITHWMSLPELPQGGVVV